MRDRDVREHRQKFWPAGLKQAGEALFGEQWKSPLARALGVSGSRQMRQWMAGERLIPPDIWPELRRLLIERQQIIQEALEKIEKNVE